MWNQFQFGLGFFLACQNIFSDKDGSATPAQKNWPVSLCWTVLRVLTVGL